MKEKLDRNQQIKDMWKSGTPAASIAQHFGVSRQRVYQVLDPEYKEEARVRVAKYLRSRYRTDKEFRERAKKNSRERYRRLTNARDVHRGEVRLPDRGEDTELQKVSASESKKTT